MHSECTILMQISHDFPGETPGPPHHPPPFGAHASVKPSASLVTGVPPAVEVLDPPLFYEYNCRILDY